MNKVQELMPRIWNLTPEQFESAALDIFIYQSEHVAVYKKFLQLLDVNIADINALHKIPFLPIELFRNHKIIASPFSEQILFESSGTTSTLRSKHFVADISMYQQSILHCFTAFYGPPSDYCILALLPSYIERENSSLVYMCDFLMQKSGHPNNGFYLHNMEALAQVIRLNENNCQKTILIGVSFALLDFAENFPMQLINTIIMETGGMKGKREEITRDALHSVLKKAFKVDTIHSEYGMTELLSQSYSSGNGLFFTPPWKKIMIRDADDPFAILDLEKNGLINIIDLANLYSCSFIAIQDTGILRNNGGFEVTGRYDTSDIRGCNLMVL